MNNSIEGTITMGEEVKTNKISKVVYSAIKRSFDVLAALIGMLFLLPMIVVVKLCYLFSGDTHSIIFTQERIGKNGNLFKLYKFRSMVPNADEILAEILKTDSPEAQEYRLMKKFNNDPRITPVGKIIRKLSIDELPQLLNILKGDMSFIGNRPYLPREREDMGKYYEDIVKTKPGLTGYWQVNLRSRGTFEQRLQMEKYYSNNYNMKLDINIFFKTFSEVLGKKGAK